MCARTCHSTLHTTTCSFYQMPCFYIQFTSGKRREKKNSQGCCCYIWFKTTYMCIYTVYIYACSVITHTSMQCLFKTEQIWCNVFKIRFNAARERLPCQYSHAVTSLFYVSAVLVIATQYQQARYSYSKNLINLKLCHSAYFQISRILNFMLKTTFYFLFHTRFLYLCRPQRGFS